MTMLPYSLLLLVSATLPVALSRQRLPLNQVSSFNTQGSPETSWAIPENSPNSLSISIALCSSSPAIPRFFLTNAGNADSLADPIPNGLNVFEIPIQGGQGSWTGPFPSGGLLTIGVNGANSLAFEVGISSTGMSRSTQFTLQSLNSV